MKQQKINKHNRYYTFNTYANRKKKRYRKDKTNKINTPKDKDTDYFIYIFPIGITVLLFISFILNLYGL